jgi:hypothetical protein
MTEFELECWARDLEVKALRDKGLSGEDAHRLDVIRYTLAAMNGLRYWPYRYTKEYVRSPSYYAAHGLRPLIFRLLEDVEEARKRCGTY